jgi:hypothetical protein
MSAIELAARIGYPVYIKTSFSWAGNGVRLCHDDAAVAAAMTTSAGPPGPIKARIRSVLNRDWFPTATARDVQAAISGQPAMYCAVAWRGRLLAGYAGIRRVTLSAQGPSTAVELKPHAEMARAAEIMIAGFGATGFFCFDFILEAGTGAAFLLECNARPNQVCHLGATVGVDLSLELAHVMIDEAQVKVPLTAVGEASISLFPQSWRQSPEAVGESGVNMDVPWDDPELLRFMVDACWADAGGSLAARDGHRGSTSRMAQGHESLPPKPRFSPILQDNRSLISGEPVRGADLTV